MKIMVLHWHGVCPHCGERGIDRNVVEFWMGHVSGVATMGGVYDKTPEIHEDVIEREYEKLEPYINIYSLPIALSGEGLKVQAEDAEAFRQLVEILHDKAKRDKLLKLLE